MSSEKSPLLCLIDASAYLHRAYHALPPLSTSTGQPVNAIYGFSRMVSKILKNEKPNYLGICFDTPKPTFRHEIFTAYKGTRKETDEALVSQLPLAFELAKTWGLPCLKVDGFEADDVISTLARIGTKRGWKVLILSGDKDILQLVQNGVVVRDEIKKVDYSEDKVREKYGISPTELIDYFCLMGDKVDNVLGVPGVGEKTAAKLIQEFHDLETLYSNLSNLKPSLAEILSEHKDRVFENRLLIRLRDDVELNISEEDLQFKSTDSPELAALLKKLEFKGDFLGGTFEKSHPELSKNTTRIVNVVTDSDMLSKLKVALYSSRVVSFDVETNSLNSRRCDIVGLAISVKEGESWYVPIAHHYMGMPVQLKWDSIREEISSIFIDPNVIKVAQNLKFDQTVLEQHGISIEGPCFDTMVAAYCLDANRSGYGLKDLAADYLGEQMVRYEELFGAKQSRDIAEIPIEQAAPYAGADAEVTLRLFGLFQSQLKDQPSLEKLFSQIEMPLVNVIRDMENAGIRVNEQSLKEIGNRFENEKRSVEKEIFSLAGGQFVINSPKQLAQVLFERLKLPSGRKTKTGFSTGEDVLSKLAKDHPIAEKVLTYRELSKLISTYVDALLELKDPQTGRVHTSFHQTGTSTGRLSSTDPNLQNIPVRTDHGREIRGVFVAAEGCSLLSADYSQIDLRSLAHISGDEALIETFRRGGDIHTSTAAQVFHVLPNEVTPEMRRRAKAINFGVVYGQQAWGLSQSLGIELSEAQDFIDQYFERYSGVKKWMDVVLAEARKNGFVSTWAGRRRRVNEINSSNASIRGFAERIAMNTPIQGTSADLIKVAMNHVHACLSDQGFKTKMLLQVHDELLFDVPDVELERVSVMIRQEMESAASLVVPLVVDLKSGKNWNDMKSFKVGVAA